MPKIFCQPRLLLSILLALTALSLNAEDFDALYSTGIGPAPDELIVLTRASQPADIHYLDAQGDLTALATNAAPGIPGWREALLPQPSHSYVGFSVSGADTLAVPIFFPDAGGVPLPERCLPLESDPQGDHQFNLNQLDILNTRVAFSETKIYYYIKCNTTTYPVNSGLTFFSYMGILTQPDAAPGSTPIVYALMNTVDAPGIISPGLYKIAGTGMSDLVNIGAIGVEVDADAGVLILSCELADLLADPDFASWFDPAYPLAATVAMTSRITIAGGNQTADTTLGSQILFLTQTLNFANLDPPQVYDPGFVWQNGSLAVTATYADADQNPAWALRVSIDGTATTPLYPLEFDGYAQPVMFRAEGIFCPQNWSTATFEVVNGGSGYTFEFPNPNVAADDGLAAPPLLEITPNPAGNLATVKALPGVPLRIYNLRGQLAREYSLKGPSAELDLTGLAPGIYLLRQGVQARRFLKY